MIIHKVTKQEYALIFGDLMRARRYLTALKATPKNQESRLMREALTLAAIVSYCRPFKFSYNAAGKRCAWIPAEVVNDLAADKRVLHARLNRARDQAWAHTDWAAHTPHSNTKDDGDSLLVVSRNPWIPLEEAEIEEFESLLTEVEARIQR